MTSLDKLLKDTLKEADATGPDEVAAALTTFYSRVVEETGEQIEPEALGRECSRRLSDAADAAVTKLAQTLQTSDITAENDLCWIATGGYGRGLLSPGSRLSLLVLHGDGRAEWNEAVFRRIEEVVRGAFPGADVNCTSTERVLQRAAEDVMGASDFLETRLIAGNEGLYSEFTQRFRDDLFIPRWGQLCADLLSESLSRRDPYTGSPYCTEPNLKEGAGCLRDIGMMQKVAASLRQVPALEHLLKGSEKPEMSVLQPAGEEFLEEAFHAILAARNALHFVAGGESDVLERSLQSAVARTLAFGENGDEGESVKKLMKQLFRSTGGAHRVLRAFKERFDHLHSMAWKEPSLRTRREVGDDFAIVEGKLYSARHRPFAGEGAAQRMMNALLLSQRQHVSVSQHLLDEIARNLDTLDDEDLWSEDTSEVFTALLNGSVGVAERLRWMRECGLLQKYVPEFRDLVHVVDYQESFDYTLDEHALQSIAVIDDLAHTDQEDELAQRELLSQVERPDIIRLACLLHHAVERTEDPEGTLTTIARRIHLSPSETELLAFLVNHRSTLTYYAERRDFHDPEMIQEAAEKVGTPQKLRLLYLFAYADCRAIGRAGWFAWRDSLLYELYQHLMATLSPGFHPSATQEHFEEELLDRAGETGKTAEAERLISNAPERYKVEVSPGQALEHLKLIERAEEQPAAMSYEAGRRQARLWFCSSDLPGRFSHVAGALTCNDLDIVSARAFTLADGTVLDSFQVYREDRPLPTNEDFWRSVEQDLVRSVEGELDVAACIRERDEGVAVAPVPTRREVRTVRFDNESSPEFTIVDVVAWDRAGLLYALCRALGEAGANIEFAKISTRLGLAQDVFYVNDSQTGEKIADDERLGEVRAALEQAISG